MIEKIIESLDKYSERNAFYINERYYTYKQVAKKVSQIRNSFHKYLTRLNPKYIGVFINNDLESYCSCIAVLLSGFGYVPLNPLIPAERNREIILQSNLKLILTSEKEYGKYFNFDKSIEFIYTKEIPSSDINLGFPSCSDEDPAYIIFTSGSTGKPKGTLINRGNLNAFLDSSWALNWSINEEDRFLQMSSMTFDMSIITFIIPLCIGACIYVVPEEEIKYSFGYKLMEKFNITFIAVVPSSISYLRPYFQDIYLPSLRYSLVCGEAFPVDLANEWARCVPNAKIINIYGPTEATVFTHTYHYQKGLNEKSYNNIMAIGAIVKNMEALIIDEYGNQVKSGEKGELCITGKQLSTGYLKNPEKNKKSFFIRIQGQIKKRYYKTGDIVFMDEKQCYFYVGRIDSQVKIQGHRVELGDIEKHARDFINYKPVVAVAHKNQFGNYQIHLFIEKTEKKKEEIIDYLKSKIPYYMIPSNVSIIDKMPLNANGKIDRNRLKQLI